MNQRTQIILTIFFPLYLMIVLFTDMSLTGFWTDVIFSIILSILAIRLILKGKSNQLLLTITSKVINSVCALTVFGLLGLNLINPFSLDTLKLRSFYFKLVDGRIFNAYFKPVGAYSGGQGNFWITESPKYFPLVELRKYYEHAITWDFSAAEWDGKPIDQDEAVRSYIKEEVIDKQK